MQERAPSLRTLWEGKNPETVYYLNEAPWLCTVAEKYFSPSGSRRVAKAFSGGHRPQGGCNLQFINMVQNVKLNSPNSFQQTVFYLNETAHTYTYSGCAAFHLGVITW